MCKGSGNASAGDKVILVEIISSGRPLEITDVARIQVECSLRPFTNTLHLECRKLRSSNFSRRTTAYRPSKCAEFLGKHSPYLMSSQLGRLKYLPSWILHSARHLTRLPYKSRAERSRSFNWVQFHISRSNEGRGDILIGSPSDYLDHKNTWCEMMLLTSLVF